MNKIFLVIIFVSLAKNILTQLDSKTIVGEDSIKTIIKELNLPDNVKIKEIVGLQNQLVKIDEKKTSRLSFGLKYEYYDYCGLLLVQVYDSDIKVSTEDYLSLKLALRDSIVFIKDYSLLEKKIKNITKIKKLKFNKDNSGEFSLNGKGKFSIYFSVFYHNSFSFISNNPQSLGKLDSMIDNNEVKLYYVVDLKGEETRTMFFLSPSSLKLIYRLTFY